jgi:ABC-type uncharacterized transport system involved in gliding motility auxiliary subunit
MKRDWRRFAPIGLYLALAAALASVGLYIIQREWNLYLQISLGLIVIGLGLFAILNPQRVMEALTGRQARYGSNALVLTLAFLGILIVVNYFFFKNSKRWDLTQDKEFTLAVETRDTLKNLPDNVQAQAFFTSRTNTDQAQNLLDQYRFYGNGKFEYKFIDPESNPVLAEEAKVTRDGTVVLNMGGNQEQVTVVSEQELTGALVRLMNPEKKKVYFLTGHGEYSPDDTGDRSYSLVKKTLEGKNYVVETLNLIATNSIPDDAKVIVIAGPKEFLAQSEIDQLGQYLNSGGTLIAMLEPTVITEHEGETDPLVTFLGQNWGIELKDDLIVDTTSTNPYLPYAYQYGNHPITEKFRNTTSVFPTARSVTASVQITGISQVQLVMSSPQSWAETSLAPLKSDTPQPPQYDEGADLPGPVSMAVAAENLQTHSKVVVFGDADFVIDGNFPAYANGDLFINSVDWAAGQEALISLTPKNQTQRLMVPPQKFTMNLVLLGMVILMPGLGLIGGIAVFIQRRRRG